MAFQYTVLPFGCPWLHARLRSAYIYKENCNLAMVKSRGQSTHQLPRNAGSMSGLSNLPARPEGKSHLGPLGQHDCGVLHESPRGAIIETPFHVSRAPSGMGSAQPALVESSTRSGQTEPRSRHVVTKQGPLRGVEASFSDGSENMVNLWLGGSRPLPFKRQFSLPNLLVQGQVCVQSRGGHRLIFLI